MSGSHRPSGPLAHVVYELSRNAKATGLDWWETCTASVVVDAAASWPTTIVFAAVAQVLRDGLDPEWVSGGRSPAAALAVAREWLEVGVEPSEVAGWLRAGCCEAATAVKLANAGLRPIRLLDDDGRPLLMTTRSPCSPRQLIRWDVDRGRLVLAHP